MKTLKTIAILALILLTSCNKDDKNDESHLLEGHWHAYDFQPDADITIDSSFLVSDVITHWSSVKCDLFEFTFTSEGRVFTRDRMSYVIFSQDDEVKEDDCSVVYDDKEGDFKFDNKQLTLLYDDSSLVMEASVDGEYLTTKITDLEINGTYVSGTLLFLKEEALGE